MSSIRAWLKVIFTPSCWLQNNVYSETWDKKLNQLMAIRDFDVIDEYHAKIGGYTVWIKNHPYASFSPVGPIINVRPRRSTILMAGEKVINDLCKRKTILETK